jgi:hypothetical protein
MSTDLAILRLRRRRQALARAARTAGERELDNQVLAWLRRNPDLSAAVAAEVARRKAMRCRRDKSLRG